MKNKNNRKTILNRSMPYYRMLKKELLGRSEQTKRGKTPSFLRMAT